MKQTLQKRNTKRCSGRAAIAVSTVALLFSACATPPDSFKIADTSGDGRVESAEFGRYMLEAIYAEADANRDKKITFEEWKAANPDAEQGKFKAPDRNRDGVVTPQEAKRHFDRQGTMEDLFDKIDANNDGYVTREENAAFKKKLEAQSGTPLQKLSRTAAE